MAELDIAILAEKGDLLLTYGIRLVQLFCDLWYHLCLFFYYIRWLLPNAHTIWRQVDEESAGRAVLGLRCGAKNQSGSCGRAHSGGRPYVKRGFLWLGRQ